VQNILTIGSVKSAPHMSEIYSYPRCLTSLPFFILPTYNPIGDNHLDHNASIDADFLKKVSFGALEI
jgi:hypothetical protein